MVTALQQQLSHCVRPQQEVDQLIQQEGGLDESDGSTEEGGGDHDHLLTPEAHKHTCASERAVHVCVFSKKRNKNEPQRTALTSV